MDKATEASMPVLLVDDEPQILLSSGIILRSAGIKDVLTIENSMKVLPLLAKREVAVIVLDLFMPYLSGTELLAQLNGNYPHIPVIIMTAANELETAVECMKAGAFDYLVKPVENSRFISSVKRALELGALRSEVTSLKQHLLNDQLEQESAFSSIITKSKKMRAIFQYVEVIAKSNQPVLITGETGVGKELIAKSIHSISGRSGKLVAVNVAGLDDTVFSDSLFGHKKGAYTGAEQQREGLIAQAAHGTLFLDEIGDLNESSQVKLLRLLQEQEYYPIGSDIPKKSDARIIASTNHDLQKLISSGKFRKDLYFRLRSHQIHIPPLRERPEDIPMLVKHFIEKAASFLRKKKPAHPPELISFLLTYHFPGNIRELQGMVFDAVTRHQSGILSMVSFKEVIGQERSLSEGKVPASSQEPDSLSMIFGRFPSLKETEDYLISEAMRASKDNQGTAASLLGITRQALNKRLNRKRV